MNSIENCLHAISDDVRLKGQLRRHLERLEMDLRYVYMLHAKRTDFKHEFVEIFSSMDQLEGWLFNHPETVKCEITIHEVNPA